MQNSERYTATAYIYVERIIMGPYALLFVEIEYGTLHMKFQCNVPLWTIQN